MYKICSCCNVEKPLTEFYKAKKMKDGYQSSCKKCNDIKTAKSRAANPDKYRERRQLLRHEYVQRYNEWKHTQSCLVCSEDDVVCLDLHHLDPSEKDVELSFASRRWSWEKLQAEIAKCVVLCRNCHAKVHAGVISLPS